MATRSTKAAATAKPKAAPKAPKAPKKAAAKKAAAPKAAKPAKGRAGGKGRRGKKDALAFDEPQAQPVAFEEERPGFFERWRQRRAEKARARAEAAEAERARQEKERAEAAERQRLVDEEQARLREEQEKAERKQREREEAEARKAEEAIREAAEEAEKARKAEEARVRRAAEREAKRRELELEERRKADEQAARDAEEEAERRRLAVQERLRQEAEAKAAEAARSAEPEPDMEFQEPSTPVAAGSEMVPAEGRTAADAQADLMAAELARRRSKPIVIEEELPEPPKIPKAPLRPGEEYRDAPSMAPPPPKAEPAPEAEAPQEEFGYTLPEAFLLIGAGGQWDERLEKNKEGSYGGALAGSLVLELLMAKALLIQRDRFVPTGVIPDDPALAAVLDRLRRIREKKGDITTLRQMGELAKWNRELLLPAKDSLQSRALAAHGARRHLGLFHRSWLQVTDDLAQERLQNRLRRAIAGGGTPEPRAVLLLGLLDATGQFGTVVPDEAADYNRKRLNGLLGGRDIMGYKVHPDLKALQELAVRTVLANVRIMTIRG